MKKNIPPELSGYILPFDWDVKKVWEQKAPVENLPLEEFEFMLDLPFWSSRPNSGMLFDVTPGQVMAELDMYPHQKKRIQNADTGFPVDFIHDGGVQYILDGLHRIARLKMSGETRLRLRRHGMSIRARIEADQSLK